MPGGTGPFTGSFPSGLLNDDANNLGPRLGLAYRVNPRHDSARWLQHHLQQRIYASIARELVGQPPFADTETITGTPTGPLTLAEALLSSTVDDDQQLGRRQGLRARHDSDVERDRHARRHAATGRPGRLHGNEGHGSRYPARAESWPPAGC